VSDSVLITGAAGSMGRALSAWLPAAVGVDRDEMDVCDLDEVIGVFGRVRPEWVYHLAAAKHAPEGELDPWDVTRTNIEGTRNVLLAAAAYGARVVVASTCKAADPETVYGASKLVAERMTLNAGQSVARFYNVRESCGNVFEKWRDLPFEEPIPWTHCWRYFISSEQAVGLLIACAYLPPGRYTVNPGKPEHMEDVARKLYPGRPLVQIPRRRGDRMSEPRCAVSEHRSSVGEGYERIVGEHDAVRMLVAA
jgi:FlaA1/EpsC-like NDP-sugar epimerase